MKLLLYCTKAKNELERLEIEHGDFWYGCPTYTGNETPLNGKIVAECDCDKVEFIKLITDDPLGAPFYETDTLDEEDILKQSCLNADELYKYLEKNNGYALHLSNLKVFDEPKELSEFKTKQTCCKNSFGHLVYEYYPIKKAPQNMMKCFDKKGNEYILLSIKPQHLYNILNGDKTIEVRKKILNCMKELIR